MEIPVVVWTWTLLPRDTKNSAQGLTPESLHHKNAYAQLQYEGIELIPEKSPSCGSTWWEHAWNTNWLMFKLVSAYPWKSKSCLLVVFYCYPRIFILVNTINLVKNIVYKIVLAAFEISKEYLECIISALLELKAQLICGLLWQEWIFLVYISIFFNRICSNVSNIVGEKSTSIFVVLFLRSIIKIRWDIA